MDIQNYNIGPTQPHSMLYNVGFILALTAEYLLNSDPYLREVQRPIGACSVRYNPVPRAKAVDRYNSETYNGHSNIPMRNTHC